MRHCTLIGLIISALLSISACSLQINQDLSPTETVSGPVNGTASIPVTWGSLNLTGRLIYDVARFTGGSNKGGLAIDVAMLDLVTGKVTTIFETPVGGWINSMAVSPDLHNLTISYAPPSDPPVGNREALYSLPLDGSTPPQLLFIPPADKDQYYQPAWSPEGKYLYFTHANYQASTTYEVMRLAYPNGKMERVVNHASWPRISKDGSQLVYVSTESANGPNGLFIANADGTEARSVSLLGSNWMNSIIDAPLFLPDGQTILFSGPIPPQGSATLHTHTAPFLPTGGPFH